MAPWLGSNRVPVVVVALFSQRNSLLRILRESSSHRGLGSSFKVFNDKIER